MRPSKATAWQRVKRFLGLDAGLVTGTGGARPYSGAAVNRLTADWVTSPLSADRELLGDLKLLRARSRELVRNTGLGRQYLRLSVTNIIGAEGVMCDPRQKRGDRTHDVANDRVRAAWAEWGKRTTCTADGRLSWHGVEKLAVATWKQDGEALIEMLPGFDNPWGLALRFWDADQLDHELNRTAANGLPEIRMGIELNSWGRPLAYHVWRAHPSEYTQNERVRIPADRMIHLFEPVRAGQTRGVPGLAAVMMEARMLQGYREAELVAARTAAAKMGFIQQASDDSGLPVDINSSTPAQMDAAPGVIDTLAPGQTFAAWDPQHPTTAFDGFCKAVTRHYAAGAGLSYMSLSGDLSDTSYSSGRIGLLAERDVWEDDQQTVIEALHGRVFGVWLQQAILSGQLPSAYSRAADSIVWRPRRWPWVDPQKDLEAAKLGIEQGLTSRTRICAETGQDAYEVMEELAEEEDWAEELGLTLGAPAPAAPAPMSAPMSNPSADAEEADAEEGDAEDQVPVGGRFRVHPFERTNGRGST